MKLKPYTKLAEIYDSIFKSKKFYKNYYDFIFKILKNIEIIPKSILELACGTGILAKIFLDKGFSIEGLDISKNMLEVAEKKGINTHLANMINFKLGKKYDLILCIFDSLNYIQNQSDLLCCFRSVKKHLSEKGLFIFDMNSDYYINEVIPRHGNEYHKIGNIECIWLNSHEPNTWISELIFFEEIEGGVYRRYYERHVEKAYKLTDIKNLLKKAEFYSIETYSWFDFSELGDDTQRWFFVCSPCTRS